MGLQNAEYSYAAAVDLFNSAVNFIFLISVNKLSKKMTEVALW
jgi:putative aldouronate transport system permease protein